MKYWLQHKAPAGNWVDSVGSDDRESIVSYVPGEAKLHGSARAVERTDVVICEAEAT